MFDDPDVAVPKFISQANQRQALLKILISRFGLGPHAGEELHAEIHLLLRCSMGVYGRL